MNKLFLITWLLLLMVVGSITCGHDAATIMKRIKGGSIND